MSIFFDFDVGARGRRFRLAVDTDKYDIDLFRDQEHASKIFGEVDIGSLIELSVLAICMINDKKKVVGFMALSDHPNVPSVAPSDWEFWMRNMYNRFYLARDTLFVHYMCCADAVLDVFTEEAWESVFNNDEYLKQIVLSVPPTCPHEELTRYSPFRKHLVSKLPARRADDCEPGHYIYVAIRKDFCSKLVTRRAVEEDNDDIVEILDKLCPRLRELYGDYYISEIIGRHPESKRQIIVAQQQDKAIGVMCLNTDIDYHNLAKDYELVPYFGLKKPTKDEKYEQKYDNPTLTQFSDPILLGERSPFYECEPSLPSSPELSTKHEDAKSKGRSRRTSSSGRVNFGESAMRDSFDHLYFNKHSDDYSDKVYHLSATMSMMASPSVILLEEDPFDYDIVNIDSTWLTVPEVMPFTDSNDTLAKKELKARRRSTIKLQRYKRQLSIMHSAYDDDLPPEFQGEPNAFMIELYALRDDIDGRKGFDLLEASFEMMKDYEYCLIRVPCNDKSILLLKHFCFVPSRGDISNEYALYIAHRNSVMSRLRVRQAEIIDIPNIVHLMRSLDAKETMWIVEHSMLGKKQHNAYVLMSDVTLVGFGILEPPPEQIDFLQAKFNMDYFYIDKYHYTSSGSQVRFATLKTAMVYPVFEPHFRFFSREMMRFAECDCLIWLTGYRNKWVIHKANCMAVSMVPLMPRKSESICAVVTELKKLAALSRSLVAFSTWFINKKLTSVVRLNIDTRIVVVGASRTAMAFLNTLLFSDASSYLTFTNVTLVSPAGLPYVRHCKRSAEMMFVRHRTNTDQFLKSTPYTYYLNVVHATVVEINKQDKYIKVSNGHKYYYDKLFLLLGKQYQHPEYLKSVFERQMNVQYGNGPTYTRLDDPSYEEQQVNTFYYMPDNVFIINNIHDANKALRFIKNFCWKNKVIVYGCSIHAYCCLAALLDMNVPPAHIAFVEPFPSENPRKIRVPVFNNVYVDQTMREVLKDLGIVVYSSYYFQSWTVDMCNLATHVNFISHFKSVDLECSALFYYGVRGVDTDAFLAIHKSGMGYDSGILIDHQFQTKDPSIYAAGPVTRYFLRYFSDRKRQKYYDSYEIGERLGNQIRNLLNPLFTEKATSKDVMKSFIKNVSFDSANLSGSTQLPGQTEDKNKYKPQETKQEDKMPSERVPEFVNPIVKHCMMPGGFQYLEVQAPGFEMPHHYVQSLDFNGFVLETFKSGYFKLHLTRDLIVDGITCLTTEKYSIGHFKGLYGKSTLVLNNVYLRYTAKKIDNFYDFFNSPGIMFLYHEHVNELFMMVKELLPVGQFDGETLKEALVSVAGKLCAPLSKHELKLIIRSKFEKSPHVEAITEFVVEWLSENDALLPMYLQPSKIVEFTHDLNRNPVFQRTRRSVLGLFKKVF